MLINPGGRYSCNPNFFNNFEAHLPHYEKTSSYRAIGIIARIMR